MKLNILAFGIVKDYFGAPAVEAEVPGQATTRVLKATLEQRYPKLRKLASYMIAVNSEYAEDDSVLHEKDEIAVIPPVSGG